MRKCIGTVVVLMFDFQRKVKNTSAIYRRFLFQNEKKCICIVRSGFQWDLYANARYNNRIECYLCPPELTINMALNIAKTLTRINRHIIYVCVRRYKTFDETRLILCGYELLNRVNGSYEILRKTKISFRFWVMLECKKNQTIVAQLQKKRV